MIPNQYYMQLLLFWHLGDLLLNVRLDKKNIIYNFDIYKQNR